MKRYIILATAVAVAAAAAAVLIVWDPGPRRVAGRPHPAGVPQSPSPAIRRILVLDSQAQGHYQPIGEGRRAILAARGYQEGKNLEVTWFAVDNSVPEAEAILQRELPKGYDLINTNGTIPTIAAKNVAFKDPRYTFVFASVTDPVGVGVIENFEDPPRWNFTGVCYPVPVDSRLRFIRKIMPEAKTIGLIYADMPQSHSYRRWVEDLLAHNPEFHDLRVEFRMVPLVTGELGNAAMARSAIPYIRELDGRVDVFLSPNDQMGVQKPFAEMVDATATKPLVGLGRNDVMDGWGATMSIFPSHHSMGAQSGRMIADLLDGKRLDDLTPEFPRANGVAFDMARAQRHGLAIPAEMIALAGDDLVGR